MAGGLVLATQLSIFLNVKHWVSFQSHLLFLIKLWLDHSTDNFVLVWSVIQSYFVRLPTGTPVAHLCFGKNSQIGYIKKIMISDINCALSAIEKSFYVFLISFPILYSSYFTFLNHLQTLNLSTSSSLLTDNPTFYFSEKTEIIRCMLPHSLPLISFSYLFMSSLWNERGISLKLIISLREHFLLPPKTPCISMISSFVSLTSAF